MWVPDGWHDWYKSLEPGRDNCAERVAELSLLLDFLLNATAFTAVGSTLRRETENKHAYPN